MAMHNGVLEACVGFLSGFFATRLGVRYDGLGDVRVLLDGQMEELAPVSERDQFDVVLCDVAHEVELVFEELAVHLVGFDGNPHLFA